jgi:hypothetical protein
VKPRLTLKFWLGCVTWVVGSGVNMMAYMKLSRGLGGGIWVGAFIIMCWAIIAYTIFWGEVFTCGCDSSRGSESDAAKDESLPASERGGSWTTENPDLQRGLGDSQNEAEAGRTSGQPRTTMKHRRD